MKTRNIALILFLVTTPLLVQGQLSYDKKYTADVGITFPFMILGLGIATLFIKRKRYLSQ